MAETRKPLAENFSVHTVDVAARAPIDRFQLKKVKNVFLRDLMALVPKIIIIILEIRET